MSRKSFYELCTKLHLFVEETDRVRRLMPVEVQVVSFLYFISVKGHHRKTANAFGISTASVWTINKKVFYAITNFSGSEFIKLPTDEKNVKELINLRTRKFSQCVGTMDDTNIEIAKLN